MPSINIYTILSSKTNNQHFLKRYYNFILACQKWNINLDKNIYVENHHIVPKSIDLFPEYKNIKIFPWNNIKLTYRQHFIAHWLLWKAYGGRQTFAFMSMANNMNPKQMGRTRKNLNSKVYELLKFNAIEEKKKCSVGKASYRDKDGNKVYCSTTDPRVLSGELISASCGRRYKWKSDGNPRKATSKQIDGYWRRTPIRKITLYFFEIKITIEYTRDNFIFLEYLEQGWVTKITSEYRTKRAIDSNKNRSKESREKAGRSISLAKRKNKI